jgi:hypothetical protein
MGIEATHVSIVALGDSAITFIPAPSPTVKCTLLFLLMRTANIYRRRSHMGSKGDLESCLFVYQSKNCRTWNV